MTLKKLPSAVLAILLPFAASAQDAVIIGEDGFVPFKCPIEKIRIAYQNLVDPTDTLVALAIEKQTLAICRQSQESLIRIAENEAKLRVLFAPFISRSTLAPEPVREPEPETESMAALGPEQFFEPVPESFFEPVPESFFEPVPEPFFEPVLDENQPDISALTDLFAIKTPEYESEIEPELESNFTPPSYTVAAIMKDPLGWKAMIVDENAIFTVRKGDLMDDKSTIISIERGRVELLSQDNNTFFLE